MNTNETPPASRVRARGRDQMGDGYVYTCKSHRSRARACEDFYGPAIARDTDEAVDWALKETGGDANYRSALCFYCLRLGINTFMDQLFSVMSCYQQGELEKPAQAFHARLRKMYTKLYGRIKPGGAK